MKEYSGYDIKINGRLENDLRRTKDANTLYVSRYYFALNDRQNLIIYYNPQHFWDKIPVEKVDDYFWERLKQECAVFKNFDPDEETKGQFLKNKKSHPDFFPETPKIGNHYSFLGNRVVSHHGNSYFLEDLGGCSKIKT